MANNYFKFKQFTVYHDRCAMKVGTDGVLLGAWARGGKRILDIGTGSGLIALFMASRFNDAEVVAIDIDKMACEQAEDNVKRSAFSNRIKVINRPLQDFDTGLYDSIVCNPPFFDKALKSNDERKATARHTDTLSFKDLFGSVARLLTDKGEFSVVIPSSSHDEFDLQAAYTGLFPSRVCEIKTLPHKPVSRVLLAYTKHPSDNVETETVTLNNADMTRSDWYQSLTADFYL